MNLIGKLSDGVFQIEKFLVSIFVSLMFISLTMSVIFRYAFNHPLHWADETAIFSMIWTTFIGGSMGIKRQQAAAVTLITDKLKGAALKAMLMIAFLITFAFCLFILILAYQWISAPAIWFQNSTSMNLPMFYPYLSVPVGFLFMTIHAFDLVLKTLTSKEVG